MIRFKQQCTAEFKNNKLSLRGTDSKELADIIADALLLIPTFEEYGAASLGAVLQAKVIYARHKEALLNTPYLLISGHSLGAGIGCIIALMMIQDGYRNGLKIEGKGGIKVLSREAQIRLSNHCIVEWEVQHRDIVPVLGYWKAPIHNTKRSGPKKKHMFDYSIQAHVNYWG